MTGWTLDPKGTPPGKKCFLSGIARMRGGGPARIFLTFFHHVLVPKIGNLLPKTLNICMLFGNFLLSLSSKYHHNYHWTVIMIIGIFSVIRAKRRF